MKVVYVKFLFLTDSRKNKDTPVFYRSLRRSTKREPIFDSAMYYVCTEFNSQQKGQRKFNFYADSGTVGEAILLHPPSSEAKVAKEDPYLQDNRQYYSLSADPSIDNVAISVAHFYNTFQDETEHADAVAFENTRELKLSVDFSSIVGIPGEEGKEKSLFKGPLVAYLMDKDKNKEPKEVQKFNDIQSKFFSVSYKNVEYFQSLRLEWSTNWENLASLQIYNRKPGNIITKQDRRRSPIF